MGALLVGEHFRSWIEDGSGDNVPAFDPGVRHPWLPLVLSSLVVDVVVHLTVLRQARWTMPAAAVNLGSGLLFAVPAVYPAAREALFNLAFLAKVGLDGAAFDAGLTFLKARRSEQAPSAADRGPQTVR